MTDDERIDLVLTEMGHNGTGILNLQKYLSETLHDTNPHSFRRITVFLVDKGWARRIPNVPLLEILSPGLDILKFGGYLKYLEQKRLIELEEKEWDVTKRNLDEVNLKLNVFYLKYKQVPFILSGIAILLSIAALIISLF